MDCVGSILGTDLGVLAGSDSDQFAPQSHSLRLRGGVTSIRLERIFWRILAEMAEQDGVSLNQLIARICVPAIDLDLLPRNHASVLRVMCVLYLKRKTEAGFIDGLDDPVCRTDSLP